MADILETVFYKCFYVTVNYYILIQISSKFVLNDTIDNNSGLIQVMAWHQAGNKPLPEPMLTKLKYVWRHMAAVTYNEGWTWHVVFRNIY